MFEVSEKAQEMIKKILAERGENAPVRVLLFRGGVSGSVSCDGSG